MDRKHLKELCTPQLAAGREMVVRNRMAALENAVNALESITEHYDYSRLHGCELLGNLSMALQDTQSAIVNLALEASDDNRARLKEILGQFGMEDLVE